MEELEAKAKKTNLFHTQKNKKTKSDVAAKHKNWGDTEEAEHEIWEAQSMDEGQAESDII